MSQYLQQRIGKIKWFHNYVRRRGKDSGAKLVGSVKNIIMPVRDTLTPINTVALLHDLPTMVMSGSARKKAHMTSASQCQLFVNLNLLQVFFSYLDRVFRCTDFGAWCVKNLQDGMRHCGFGRASEPASVKQTIGFADCLFKPPFVVRIQPKLFLRCRLTRRQHTHHHVFNPTRRKNSGNGQLNV